MFRQNNSNEIANVQKNNWPIIITIFIGAWLIGMSILGAGYMIAREVANSNPENQEIPKYTGPVDIEVPAGLPVQGDNNAKVTIVEFADFQCPFCGEWHKEVYPQLKSEYIDTGKARFVYMDFAFLGEESVKAAEAGRCAADQGKFWEYHDELFERQEGENEGAFADDKLKEFAADVGLDLGQFNSCLGSRTHRALIEESTSKAGDYGVNSTPTVFINGIKMEGVTPYSQIKQVIESELAK